MRRQWRLVKTAVITAVHGRGDHLRRQLDGISRGTVLPDLHIVVAIDDPAVRALVTAADNQARVVRCDGVDGPLPIAAARNAGARAALDCGAELLVFLDVDCIPGAHLVGRYRAAAATSQHGDALLCGAVTYLPPPSPAGYPASLESLTNPHPARPAPPDGVVIPSTAYDLFWSLSFALTAATWRRSGGFCLRYRGYGAEDTDFAQVAASKGIPMAWVGGADAFHQFHPVSDPPFEHVHDIVRNAGIFHARWGWWPMEGWLMAFEERGIITRDADGRPTVVG
jgi:GT2 family glycosyltransferase